MRLLWKTTLPCTFPSKSSLIKECFWNSQPVNCSILFRATPTDSGMCCSFNLASSLKNGSYKDIISELQLINNPSKNSSKVLSFSTITNKHKHCAVNINLFLRLMKTLIGLLRQALTKVSHWFLIDTRTRYPLQQ